MTSGGPLDLDPIRARAGRATAGPWDWARPHDGGPAFITASMQVVLEGRRNDSNDAEFIAHARSDVPALLDFVDRSRAMLNERMEAARAEISDLRAQLAAVEQHMRERHSMRQAEVYSAHHHDSDHETEDARCSEDCFESMLLCSACGSAPPCLEIKAFRAAASRASDEGADQ